MKGNNTLNLNEATMVEAVQLWANSTFLPKVKVLTVKQVDSPSRQGFGVTCFEVTVESKDEEKAP
jgi:hypothetical protein